MIAENTTPCNMIQTKEGEAIMIETTILNFHSNYIKVPDMQAITMIACMMRRLMNQ